MFYVLSIIALVLAFRLVRGTFRFLILWITTDNLNYDPEHDI